jgi:phosphoribosyl 1,2-cyclic phosphate phosphodiesterase
VKLTFLGTGTSFGIPQLGCDCRVCRSPDPRDRRTRVGAVVETDGSTRILIDTPPELRIQLLAAGISAIDAVLFTHDHADHMNGVDDVRAVVRGGRGVSLPMYGSAATIDALQQRFRYIFDGIAPLPGTSKPAGTARPVTPGQAFRVGDLDVIPFEVPHGHTTVLGYRFGPLGYVTDAKALPDGAMRALAGVRVLVLNALFPTEHPTHLSIPEAVETAKRVGAERTFFTHLTHRSAHADLEAELPPGIAPAYDGLVVEV